MPKHAPKHDHTLDSAKECEPPEGRRMLRKEAEKTKVGEKRGKQSCHNHRLSAMQKGLIAWTMPLVLVSLIQECTEKVPDQALYPTPPMFEHQVSKEPAGEAEAKNLLLRSDMEVGEQCGTNADRETVAAKEEDGAILPRALSSQRLQQGSGSGGKRIARLFIHGRHHTDFVD
jgi:hypothetical protein